MNDLRTAAQQALEALEKLVVGSEYEDAIEAERAITALRAALAEPDRSCPTCVSLARAVMMDQTGYDTAPPQRKPLTEEEIRDLWSWSMTAEAEHTATTQQHAFARAIERAHGIGGQDD